MYRRVMSWRSFFWTTGLSHWHKQRQEWVGRQKPQQRKLREPVIKYDQHVSFGREFASFIGMEVAVSCAVMWSWKFSSRTTSIFLKPCGWIGLICWMWWLLSCRWSSTYEELLGTSRPFTQPVPFYLYVLASLLGRLFAWLGGLN